MPKYNTVLAPDLGLCDSRLDTQIVSSKLATNMKNIKRWGNTISQRPGRIAYGTVSGVPLEFFHFRVANINRFIVLTTTKAYYRSTTGWEDVTGTAFTGTNTDFWDTTMAYDGSAGEWYVVATNGVDDIKKYTGAGGTDFVDLGGWDGVHKAKYCRYYKGYLVCAYITTAGTDYPFRLITSDTDAPEDLTGNSRTFNLTEDRNMSQIMALELFDEYLAVYKEDAIYIGYLTGDSVNIFSWDLTISGIGLRAPRGIVNTPYGHFFLGWDNIYWWKNAGSRPDPIGTNSMRYNLFDAEASSTLDRTIAVYAQEDNQVRFYCPSGTIYVYEINNGSWFTESVESVTAVNLFFRDIGEQWDEQTDTWNAAAVATDRWNDRDINDNFALLIEGLNGGVIHYADNDTLNDRTTIIVESRFDTADRIYEEQQTEEVPFNNKRILGVRFQAKGASGTGTTGHLDLYYSTDEGDNWIQITIGLEDDDNSVWNTTCPLTSEYLWYEGHFDVSCKRIRFRFENTTSESTFYLRSWMEIYEDQAWEG